MKSTDILEGMLRAEKSDRLSPSQVGLIIIGVDDVSLGAWEDWGFWESWSCVYELLLGSAIKQALNSRKKQQLKKNSPHEKYDSRGAVGQLAELVV